MRPAIRSLVTKLLIACQRALLGGTRINERLRFGQVVRAFQLTTAHGPLPAGTVLNRTQLKRYGLVPTKKERARAKRAARAAERPPGCGKPGCPCPPLGCDGNCACASMPGASEAACN